jgi:hypothetical protein
MSMANEVVTYRRSELYEQIWKEPVRNVARTYGISDVWLAKICRRLSVPRPPRGYWIRQRSGWPQKPLPLPPLPEGKAAEITVPRRRQMVFLGRLLRPEDGEQVPRPKPPVIEVPERLNRPHTLVAQAAKLLRGSASSYGYVSCWSVSCLKVSVTRPSLSRALRVMDALLKALEDRSYQVEVTKALSREEADRARYTDTPSNVTRALVSGEWIQFGIFEKQTTIRETAEPPKGMRGQALQSWTLSNRPVVRYEPNGQLDLRILNCDGLGVRKTWSDSKRQTVEQGLGAFVASIEVAAEAAKQQRLEREERHREWEEKRRLEEEARNRAREEAEREKQFEEKLDCWRLARDAREYVREARALVADANGTVEEGSPLDQSLKWAEAYADRVDPLTALRGKVAGTGGSDTNGADSGTDDADHSPD